MLMNIDDADKRTGAKNGSRLCEDKVHLRDPEISTTTQEQLQQNISHIGPRRFLSPEHAQDGGNSAAIRT
jgi:hypothetical protein